MSGTSCMFWKKQCVVVCCIMLQCVLKCVAVCCSVLQCVAVCCSVLQCVAVCCSVLQCVAVCCSVLQRYLVHHKEGAPQVKLVKAAGRQYSQKSALSSFYIINSVAS